MKQIISERPRKKLMLTQNEIMTMDIKMEKQRSKEKKVKLIEKKERERTKEKEGKKARKKEAKRQKSEESKKEGREQGRKKL